MPINYHCLGGNDRIRKRRYDVLAYYVRNATAPEISKALDITERMVYNDITAIQKSLENSIPLEIIKGVYTSAFELKIRELEVRANKADISDNSYNALQKLILDNRMASMKLMGMLSDKVELTSNVPIQIIIERPDDTNQMETDDPAIEDN